MKQDNRILLDFGRGPEPAVTTFIDGRRVYVSRREEIAGPEAWLRDPVLDDPEWRKLCAELERGSLHVLSPTEALMEPNDMVMLDFGRGPEPAVTTVVNGRCHYVCLREEIEDMEEALRDPVIDDPEWQELMRRIGNREFSI